MENTLRLSFWGRQLSEVCYEIHEPRKRINIQLCFVFVFPQTRFFLSLSGCVCDTNVAKSMALAKQNRERERERQKVSEKRAHGRQFYENYDNNCH